MSPIEKSRAKSVALKALGLGLYANDVEIRDAWKRIAFETHPDRNGSTHAEFARAKAAYDFLRNGANDENFLEDETSVSGRSSRSGIAKRPRITTRTVPLSASEAAECQAILAAQACALVNGENAHVVDLDAGGSHAGHSSGASTDHVPEAVQRHGRHLTYVVRTPLVRGTNRVAVPTALLEDIRKVKPMIVRFLSFKSGPGEIRVPEEVLSNVFPGARIVDIRFSDA
ncbi:J domain-containing protein [Ostreiculturibacter nitratireducens]|uniref:J domain-containing protein n=1 Tax=Ostreiculturibacter nitratireducens TaxID=3075226 RepID=UPI0031B5C77C